MRKDKYKNIIDLLDDYEKKSSDVYQTNFIRKLKKELVQKKKKIQKIPKKLIFESVKKDLLDLDKTICETELFLKSAGVNARQRKAS